MLAKLGNAFDFHFLSLWVFCRSNSQKHRYMLPAFVKIYASSCLYRTKLFCAVKYENIRAAILMNDGEMRKKEKSFRYEFKFHGTLSSSVEAKLW